jgi:hypothetical protein
MILPHKILADLLTMGAKPDKFLGLCKYLYAEQINNNSFYTHYLNKAIMHQRE